TGQTKSINGPAFTRNGGITKIQRNGLRADGTYGKVDDLSIQYSGNRAMGVTDAAPVVTQNGSMDYPGGNTSKVLTYNAFGALVSDGGRGITSISYDNFGNPTQIQYSGSGNTLNTYSATGEKLKTEHLTTLTSQSQVAPMMWEDLWEDLASIQSDGMDAIGVKVKTTTEYHGPVIYRDGKIDMVLFPGGYATVSGTSVTFHYYTQDYLGNNRAVINGSTGAVEQTVAYYPYGAVIADLGTPTTGQPYKFGGKELITANGLNEYDFGARQYYSALPAFTRIDPMAEKYPWLSPYLYCANDPINLVDPTGMIWAKPEDAERLMSNVKDRIQNLQNQVSVLEVDLNNPDITDKEKKSTSSLIKENKEKISLLENSIKTIGIMGADQEHIFEFESTDGNHPNIVRQGEDGTVYVQASSDSMALHEITHVGQSLEQGELVFVGNVLRNASTELGGAVKNEIAAYRTQFAMDPFNMPIPVISIKLINNRYLQHIQNPQTGKPLYPYLQ
ncbi:MAG: hypothetical protein K2H22_00990, partial [Muribaculaceae bacterium]|nr:hypothetical protein [Muribaculaceae bacterium]